MGPPNSPEPLYTYRLRAYLAEQNHRKHHICNVWAVIGPLPLDFLNTTPSPVLSSEHQGRAASPPSPRCSTLNSPPSLVLSVEHQGGAAFPHPILQCSTLNTPASPVPSVEQQGRRGVCSPPPFPRCSMLNTRERLPRPPEQPHTVQLYIT